MKFSIKDFFSKCDQIRSLLQCKNQISVHVFLMEGYDYAILWKELLLASFIERFKVATLGKSNS